jgi:hypothetical protein
MPKFTAKVVIDYDGQIGVEPGTIVTKAKRNEMMRDVVYLQLVDALRQYGLDPVIVEVRKMQNA